MPQSAVEYARVKNGVVRPISDWIEDSPDHLLIVMRKDELGANLGSLPERAAAHADTCPTNKKFHSVAIDSSAGWSLGAAVLTVTSCQHQTAITCGHDELSTAGPDADKSDSAEEAVRVAKRMWSELSRTHRVDGFIDNFQSWLRTQLEIRLNEAIRHPYSMALSWTGADEKIGPEEFLKPLIIVRAALSDLYALSKTRPIDPEILTIIDNASRRIEVALVSLTAWQTVILQNAARKLAEVSERRELEERLHSRRIADLGAVTLFPMLIFSFLGANVLPPANFPYALKGPVWLVLSILAAAVAAISGRAWIRRWKPKDRTPDRKER